MDVSTVAGTGTEVVSKLSSTLHRLSVVLRALGKYSDGVAILEEYVALVKDTQPEE